MVNKWYFTVNDELREQIEDVNDSTDPSSSGSDDTLDAASANLLLQAILSVGGKQTAALYGLVGLLDRYSEVLRGVSLPENEKSHAVLLDKQFCDRAIVFILISAGDDGNPCAGFQSRPWYLPLHSRRNVETRIDFCHCRG